MSRKSLPSGWLTVAALALAVAVGMLAVSASSGSEANVHTSGIGQGDIDCSVQVTAEDAISLVQALVGVRGAPTNCHDQTIPPSSCDPGPAPSTNCDVIYYVWVTTAPGAVLPARFDVDCSGTVDGADVLALLRYVAGVPFPESSGCTPIGQSG